MDHLVKALKEALSLDPALLSEMGVRGRQLIVEKYAWRPIGESMLEVYEWMLGRRDKPACVLE